jgi:hypothetical protein
MILVKMAAGLVIEFGVSEAGTWDRLTVRLAEGICPGTFPFEVREGASGRLVVRPLEAVEAAQLVALLGVILAHESHILAEVRKYGGRV